MTRRHLDGAAAMGPAVRQAAAGANGEAGGAARSREFCDPTQRSAETETAVVFIALRY